MLTRIRLRAVYRDGLGQLIKIVKYNKADTKLPYTGEVIWQPRVSCCYKLGELRTYSKYGRYHGDEATEYYESRHNLIRLEEVK